MLEAGAWEPARDAFGELAAGLATAGAERIPALLGLARAELELARFEDALSHLDQLLALAPDHSEAQSHRALIQLELGDAQSYAHLAALAQRMEAGFAEKFNFALAAFEAESLDEAEVMLEQALTLNPRSAPAWVHRGLLAERRGVPGRANEALEKAIALAPDSALPLLLKARLEARRGELTQALATVELALGKGLTGPELAEEHTKLLIELRRPDEAVKAARALVALTPDEGHAQYLLGLALLEAGVREEAHAVLERSLELEPEAWEARLTLARLLRDRGEADAARDLVMEGHGGSLDDPDEANTLALLLLEAHDDEGATELLRTLLERFPEHADTHLHLAMALSEGDAEAAVTEARIVLRLGSEAQRAHAHQLIDAMLG